MSGCILGDKSWILFCTGQVLWCGREWWCKNKFYDLQWPFNPLPTKKWPSLLLRWYIFLPVGANGIVGIDGNHCKPVVTPRRYNNLHVKVRPVRPGPCESHVRQFSRNWVGYHVTVTGSTWLLQGLRGCYRVYVAVTVSISRFYSWKSPCVALTGVYVKMWPWRVRRSIRQQAIRQTTAESSFASLIIGHHHYSRGRDDRLGWGGSGDSIIEELEGRESSGERGMRARQSPLKPRRKITTREEADNRQEATLHRIILIRWSFCQSVRARLITILCIHNAHDLCVRLLNLFQFVCMGSH